VLFPKLIWLGIRDLFEQFMTFALLSILWWLCAITVVAAPPASVALMSITDPRKKGSAPELVDAISVFRSSWSRAWGIALLTVPFIAMLAWNLTFFSASSHALAPMAPLWLILLVILFVVALYAFSVAGTMESGTRNAFRGAMFVLVSRPFMGLGLSLLVMFMILVMGVLIIPILFVGPALISCIANRFTLTILGEEIIDPSAPTTEREDERARGLNPDPSFASRFRGKSRSGRS
jgi:uncharacterized membrane protein YesL